MQRMEYINKFGDYSDLNTSELYKILKNTITKIKTNYEKRSYEKIVGRAVVDQTNHDSIKAMGMSVSLLDNIKIELIQDIEVLQTGVTNKYLVNKVKRLANEAGTLNKKINPDKITVHETKLMAQRIKGDLKLVETTFNNVTPGLENYQDRQLCAATIEARTTDQSKIIYISKNHGISTNKITWKPNYPVSKGRYQLIIELKSGRKSGEELKTIWKCKTLSQVSRGVSKINSLFKKNLKLKEELIAHEPARGYELSNYYKIKFVDIN